MRGGFSRSSGCSWTTFNVGDDVELQDECAGVIRAFFRAGGRLIDSSPIRQGLDLVRLAGAGADRGLPGPLGCPPVRPPPGAQSPRWEDHLRTLLEMKAAGRVRYVGITTSERRRHDEVEKIMASQPIDFVQVTYNILGREVEARILPLARERGIAVLANRPFRQAALIRSVERRPLLGLDRVDLPVAAVRDHQLGGDLSRRGVRVRGQLLGWIGVGHGRLRFHPRGDGAGVLGIALIVLGVAVYPAIAPDPTAIATLGLLLLAQGRLRWELLAVPVLGCLVSGATLWAQGSPDAWVPAVAALLAVTACGRRRRVLSSQETVGGVTTSERPHQHPSA